MTDEKAPRVNGWGQMQSRTYEERTTPKELPEGYVLNGFEMIPGETKEGFESYLCYRDQGPGRTIAETSRLLGKSNVMMVERSWRDRWKERVALYDRYVTETEQRAIQAKMDKYADILVERRMQAAEMEWQDALKIQKKTDLMLSWPTYVTETSKDGKTIKYIPYKWSATSLAQLLEQKSVLIRRSTEMPTSYTQVDLNANTSQEISTAHMTPEERERFETFQRLQAELYEAVMAGRDVPAMAVLTARVAEPEPEPTPPAWYVAESEREAHERRDEPPPATDESPLE